jgi:hypothetical protein
VRRSTDILVCRLPKLSVASCRRGGHLPVASGSPPAHRPDEGWNEGGFGLVSTTSWTSCSLIRSAYTGGQMLEFHSKSLTLSHGYGCRARVLCRTLWYASRFIIWRSDVLPYPVAISIRSGTGPTKSLTGMQSDVHYRKWRVGRNSCPLSVVSCQRVVASGEWRVTSGKWSGQLVTLSPGHPFVSGQWLVGECGRRAPS